MLHSDLDKWYVVQTKPRQEERALHNLCNQGFEPYCPKVTVERLRQGSIQNSAEPMFSSYLFIRADPSKDYSAVRSTQGVRQLLKFGGQVASVSGNLISGLKQQGQVHIPRKLANGQSISVVDGPLKGMSGILVHQDGHKRSLILFEMLNRTLEISVPNHLIAPSC